MSQHTIEPCDVLVVRDGRPKADASVGQSLAFPYPHTVAGGVRTRVGSDAGGAFVASDRLAELKQVAIRGPLLARTNPTCELFFPAPRDALLLRDAKGSEKLRRIGPLTDVGSSLGDFVDGLTPVGLSKERQVAAKPMSSGGWWSWALLEAWLQDHEIHHTPAWVHGRMEPLALEGRTHVSLGPTGTAVEGALFETRGLRFTRAAGQAHQPLNVTSHALFLDVDEKTLPNGMALRDELAPFGGERKLMRWNRAPQKLALPSVPKWLQEHVTSSSTASCSVRVVLATPAVFTAGARPAADGVLLRAVEGLSVELTAMAVGRPEVFSGWDFVRAKPKPSVRAVPAGSVLWLRLSGTPGQRLQWLERVWMQNISDEPERRCDGFGLAVVGKGAG